MSELSVFQALFISMAVERIKFMRSDSTTNRFEVDLNLDGNAFGGIVSLIMSF
jgi:hypothetical protein